MKSTGLVSLALVMGLASFGAAARHSHPVSPYSGLNVSCTCDWAAEPSTCTVMWTDVGAPTYGVSVEFNAQWTESDIDMESSAELDLDDNWACDAGVCSATGDFSLPDYAPEATIEFLGKVKGFDTGNTGNTPRDFVKETGECNLPAS